MPMEGGPLEGGMADRAGIGGMGAGARRGAEGREGRVGRGTEGRRDGARGLG